MSLQQILQKYWGFSDFRPGQEDIIQSALDGYDTIALLPTGGGKSLCYQVPALAIDGLTIVITPLIALMNDQVRKLKELNIKVEVVHSAMNKYHIDHALDNCVYGDVKLLYLSPERLNSDLFLGRAKKMNIGLIAVDEAHCISEWGYDFRPSYLKILDFREWLGFDVPCIALTATATTRVAEDIKKKLGFNKKQKFFQHSYLRDNLAYVVVKENIKIPYLLDLLKKIPGCAIVYVRSRRQTVEIAQQLVDFGVKATYYHAGVSYENRNKNQDMWLSGKARVIVSTNAFGMGIDKADVQLIVHMDVPDSLEAYFQEAGRAGRNGNKAYAILLWNEKDIENLYNYHEISFPPLDFVKNVYNALGNYYKLAVGSGLEEIFKFEIFDFIKKFKFEALPVIYALKLLDQNELLKLTDNIFTPATIQVVCSREDLYDFQLKNKKFNTILKALLRFAEGVFVGAVRVNLEKFAKFVDIPPKEVDRVLTMLKVEGIIDYKASSFAPRLTYLKERLPPNGLNLDLKIYRSQQKVKKDKLVAIEHYVNVHKCRSQLLLAYFGEKSDILCGLCDYCRGLNKMMDLRDITSYKNKFKRILKKEPQTLESLMGLFLANRHDKVLKILDYLIGEGYISKHNNKLVWIKE